MKSVYRLGRGVRQNFGDGQFVAGYDTFDESVAGAGASSDHHLFVKFRGGGNDVGKLREFFDEGAPIADAIVLGAHELDVGAGVDKAILQIAAHAVGDGESDDESGDSGGDSGDGNGRDDADDGLAPFGFQVPSRHIELKSHRACLLC